MTPNEGLDNSLRESLNPWYSRQPLMKGRDQFPDPTVGPASIYKRWTIAVNQYSKGALTCPGDKLIALYGVAENSNLSF